MSTTALGMIGIGGLVMGGEMFKRGALVSAKSFGISHMVVGLTPVGFGTSTSEVVKSLQAMVSG